MAHQLLMAVRLDHHGVAILAIVVVEAVVAEVAVMVAEVVVIKHHRIRKNTAQFFQFMHKVVVK